MQMTPVDNARCEEQRKKKKKNKAGILNNENKIIHKVYIFSATYIPRS